MNFLIYTLLRRSENMKKEKVKKKKDIFSVDAEDGVFFDGFTAKDLKEFAKHAKKRKKQIKS